ncbi:hypothetical protein JW930_04585 [Candidatus Woesearchaeota archaeon]|nr:hypothetical protein [Candidatus Woesearchaeota archaeon]
MGHQDSVSRSLTVRDIGQRLGQIELTIMMEEGDHLRRKLELIFSRTVRFRQSLERGQIAIPSWFNRFEQRLALITYKYGGDVASYSGYTNIAERLDEERFQDREQQKKIELSYVINEVLTYCEGKEGFRWDTEIPYVPENSVPQEEAVRIRQQRLSGYALDSIVINTMRAALRQLGQLREEISGDLSLVLEEAKEYRRGASHEMDRIIQDLATLETLYGQSQMRTQIRLPSQELVIQLPLNELIERIRPLHVEGKPRRDIQTEWPYMGFYKYVKRQMFPNYKTAT